MKSNRSLSDIAARVLSVEARQPVDVPVAKRAEAIQGIARAMRQRKRQSRARWAAVGGLAIAASIVFAIGLGHVVHGKDRDSSGQVPAASATFVRGSALVLREATRRPLSDGAPIAAGDRLLFDDGARASIVLANGTHVVVEDHADLLLAATAPGTMFELSSGSVRADVAKLHPNERFVIRTPDAEIEVRGTSFDVSRADADPKCGNGTTTRLKVREGVVAVRAGGVETLVRANEVWPSGCVTVVANGSPSAPESSGPASSGTPPAQASPPLVPTVAPGAPRRADAPASDLAAQNDLFDRAVSRRRASDAPGAVAIFEELLARYPSSHLAQSARAERMKLLRGIDGERAKAAARDYLKRYPNGFAHEDAELILSSSN